MPTTAAPFLHPAMQFVAWGVARVTSVLRTNSVPLGGQRVSIHIECDERAERLQNAIEQHALMVDGLLDGMPVNMIAFKELRARLRDENEEVRAMVGLREVPIRHLLPPEPVDAEVERREFVAAFDEWSKARVAYAKVANYIGMEGRSEPSVERGAAEQLRATFVRFNAANQRMAEVLDGMKPPALMEPETTSQQVALGDVGR